MTRGSLGRIYDKLDDRDLVELLPAIVKAVEQLAPSDEMFGDNIRLAGLDLLSRLHIREGLPLCFSLIEPMRWGYGKRLTSCIGSLARYGTHAKAYLPQLQEMRRQMIQSGRAKEGSEALQLLDKTIAEIQNTTAMPTLVSVKEFKARPTAAE